ncbi:MAG: type II toxin-antitoxin system PemK/MazF family toxin [Chloroflexia bacterium]|nr:type II toxin-antitoxin system PemK/MazF family toxin [Chloroflexia bacterium]
MDARQIPRFGEVWQAELDPAVGHEQAGTRPVIIVSTDGFNQNSSRLVFVAPVTRRDRRNPLHVPISASQSGLRYSSLALCDAVRSISTDRLRFWIGTIDRSVMDEIGDRLRIVLRL